MITDLKDLGKRIIDARKRKKISQLELAEMVGVSVSHMSNIENGYTSFGVEIFVKIVDALKVSADELLLISSPGVTSKLNEEFEELITDCTPSEVVAILKMAKEMKQAIHSTKSE